MTLILTIRGAKPIRVADYAEASFQYVLRIKGRGASKMPVGILTDKTGAFVGSVSYNGRVWDHLPSDWQMGSEPLYDPRKTTAEVAQ